MLKIPRPNIGKISLLVAILTWLALLFVDITRIFDVMHQLDSGVPEEVSFILELLFFITVYLFYNYNINKNENNDFLNLIWRGASTGLVAACISLLFTLFYMMLGESRLAQDPLLRNFIYHINFALITLFLVSCSLLYKHLILYQKTKKVVQQWQAFEILLLVSMFFIFFNKNTFDYSFIFGFVFLIIFSASLSINLKWIPYLTFKEKWKSILFLLTILVCISYLYLQLLLYSESDQIMVNLTDNLFLHALTAFVFLYSLFSFLVTLFTLPTSSVFEQKLIEAINFQRLSQSIKPGQDENQVLDILIDSSMSASYADAGWFEIFNPNGSPTYLHLRFITKTLRKELQEAVTSTKAFADFQWSGKHNENRLFQGKIAHPQYKSVIVVPLVVYQETIGHMYLVKEVKDGFNKEMLNIISTFVGQACISVENHRLLNEAIKNERYKEELKIAQRVQRSLLPEVLHHDESFEICAFSEAADEVGGDYYETQMLAEHQYAVIIGDVSGKGTSAAFHMSQMKGIFHSLVQSNPDPGDFIFKANKALSQCLEKNHFVTTAYYLVDTEKKSIRYSRAGHCPALFYDSSAGTCAYLSLDGMGLGIVRNHLYKKYVSESEFSYESQDILVLFTDGIIEAKNKNNIEYGYERLRDVVKESYSANPLEIQQNIISSVYGFIGKNIIPDDDYSLLVIKFK
jgi:phosphoserine phosphatase RsbU/P